MVKQTFYNLSEENRTELIKIAKKEFATRPIHEATVANIVQQYGIARSSFYNYFDNIEDLFYYILQEFKDKMKNKINESMDKNKGDIFKTFIDTFEYIIDSDNNEIDRGIMRNLFLNSNSNAQNFVMPKPDKNEIEQGIKLIGEKLDRSNLKINSDMELMLLIEMLTDNLFQNVVHFFMMDIPKKIIIEKFKKKIDIIKYGVCKEEK
ncbi:MAG: TetR/AcrR family transcriptional regulator [Clostridia bacterium]|nr:TetR/AcrR family transcriptional regulator [Clostridia bacterium]